MTSKPTNVLEALRAVSAAVDHIAKEKTARAGGTYQYRGIEDVLEACHDPFIEYGIVVVPQVVSAESVLHVILEADGTKIKRQEYEARILVNYRVYGPGGPEDFIDCPIFTTSVDSSDKQTGKAMSYAYKNLMFQLLCIPTAAAEDNEASIPADRTPAREPVPAQRAKAQVASDAEWEALAGRLRTLGKVRKSALDSVVKSMQEGGWFKPDRTPILPLPANAARVLGSLLDSWEKSTPAPALEARDDHDNDAVVPRHEVTDTVGPLHPAHAVETVCAALGVDEPPEDLDPAFWYLAEFANADEIDWKAAAKALNVTPKSILDGAKDLVRTDNANGGDLPMPGRLDDIHGHLAVETRLWLIKDSMGEPY